MPDTPDTVRATSDALLRVLEDLGALEDEKQSIPLRDPRLVERAGRIDNVSRRVLALGAPGERGVEGAPREPTDGEIPPVDDAHRSIQVILAEWRDAERRSAGAAPGSVEAIAAEARVERAREAYGRAYDSAKKAPQDDTHAA